MPTDLEVAERELSFTCRWNKAHGEIKDTCYLSGAQAEAVVKELESLRKQLAECKQTIEDIATG